MTPSKCSVLFLYACISALVASFKGFPLMFSYLLSKIRVERLETGSPPFGLSGREMRVEGRRGMFASYSFSIDIVNTTPLQPRYVPVMCLPVKATVNGAMRNQPTAPFLSLNLGCLCFSLLSFLFGCKSYKKGISTGSGGGSSSPGHSPA